MNQAERAEIVARTAFAAEWDQLAHTGRVVEELVDDGGSDVLVAAGWLHDVVEDTPLGYGDLVDMGFSEEVVEAVRLLTRENFAAAKSTEAEYAAYKEILLSDPTDAGRIARRVKLADARDNLRRCEDARHVPKWARLAKHRYEPMVKTLEGMLAR